MKWIIKSTIKLPGGKIAESWFERLIEMRALGGAAPVFVGDKSKAKIFTKKHEAEHLARQLAGNKTVEPLEE